jgi:hypothetical protein
MKRLSALAFSLALGLSLVPQLSAARQFGGRERTQGNRDGVCVYQDIQFRGWEQCYNVGDEIRSLGSRTKAISSIRVFGRARLVVWEDPEFHGNSAEFDSDVPDLGRRANGGSHTWNDQIESIKVVGDYDSRDPRDNRPPNTFPQSDRNNDRRANRITDGICVYDRPDYQGREECWGSGTNIDNLRRAGNWSDRISSIRVYGRARAVMYRENNFRGESLSIDRDIPDFSRIRGRNWNNQVSSIAVQNERGVLGRERDRF